MFNRVSVPLISPHTKRSLGAILRGFRKCRLPAAESRLQTGRAGRLTITNRKARNGMI